MKLQEQMDGFKKSLLSRCLSRHLKPWRAPVRNYVTQVLPIE